MRSRLFAVVLSLLLGHLFCCFAFCFLCTYFASMCVKLFILLSAIS